MGSALGGWLSFRLSRAPVGHRLRAWLAIPGEEVRRFAGCSPPSRHEPPRDPRLRSERLRARRALVFQSALPAALGPGERVAAYAFAILVGDGTYSLHHWLHHGFVCGLGIAATSFAINYQFANKPTVLLLIDGGYHVVQFVVYGLILGLWQ